MLLFFPRHNNRKTILIWGFISFLCTFWGIGVLIVSLTHQLKMAILGWQIAGIAVIFAPVAHHHFVLAYIESKSKKQLIILYIIAAIILFINFFFRNLFIPDFKIRFGDFYYIDWLPHKSVIYLFMYISFYWILLLYSFSLLLIHFKFCPNEKRNQLKYIMLGSILIWIGAHGDFPLVFGYALYPYSNFLFTLGCLTIGYGVIRHQAFDIEVVFQRSLVYSLLITTITIVYLLFVLLVERFSQNIFRYNSIIVSILSAFIIAIIFVPLKNQIQKFIDHLFLKQSPFQLAEQNQLLRENSVDSEKMRTIATLASGVAHEIRNPLTALKTFVEYFPKKKNDPAFIAKFESIASTEINRIESILNELLAFAKPSPLSLTDTDIKKTLEHALNLTANQLGKNKVEVKTDFSNDLPLIKADTNKLLQVFINLILNANDAMPDGGTLIIMTRGSGLVVSDSSNPSIKITFTDTGCGIEPKDLSKIFEPFFSTKEKGTGLGLAIVKGIIEDHGGKITVKSTKNQGTAFTITLPTTSSSLEVKP